MTARFTVLCVALLAAASCSSDGSGIDSAPATSDGSVPPSVEVTTTAGAPTTSIADTSVAPSTSEAPTTSAAPTSSTTPSLDAVPPTSDRPVVINGSATVENEASSEPTGAACAAIPRGVTDFVLDGGGVAHDVRIFVPETLLAEPAPVVLDWHGLGSSGPEQAAYSGYETLASSEGFITVHATGALKSWELAQFDTDERDDLAFVDVLIDTVVSDWCGDGDRVYSTGMSNGGFFTAELVCHRSDRIAAAVSVAGLSHAEGCEPTRPVPYIAFHGTDDGVVPFDGDGASVLAIGDPALEVFFSQVIPEEFSEFAADAGCDPEPTRTEESAEVIRYDYVGCEDDVPMSFYELPGSGHTWPGSPLAEQLGDAVGFHTDDVSATVDGWDFLRQFSL